MQVRREADDAVARSRSGEARSPEFLPTVFYQTFGGGFALSNEADEVILRDSSGNTIDRMSYRQGFAIEGESLGLDPDTPNASANDDSGAWCEQWTTLPFGDAGTPGEENDWCW